MHLHCGFRAEFLTAEATDAQRTVDDRFLVLDDDSLRGADVTADAAADTHILL